MQTSLFPSESPNESHIVTEDKFIQPLAQIVEQITPIPTNDQPQNTNNLQTISQSLDDLFPEQRFEEKNVQKAKEILGSLAKEFTSEQLRDTVTEVQYLTEVWLDNLERGIFDGVTFKELLHEKGGL